MPFAPGRLAVAEPTWLESLEIERAGAVDDGGKALGCGAARSDLFLWVRAAN